MSDKPVDPKIVDENKFKLLQMGIYEFLMASEPEIGEDDGYVMFANETAMAQLADDMGVQHMDLTTENAWEAIKRHMGSIVE